MELIVTNQVFYNFEHFSEAARYWDIDFLQIEMGRFRGALFQYVSRGFLFSRACFNRRQVQRGGPPPNMWTFAVSADSGVLLSTKGIETCARHLIVYPPGSEISCTTHTRFDMLIFSIPANVVASAYYSNNRADLIGLLEKTDALVCETAAMESLRFLLKSFYSELRHYGAPEERCNRRDFFKTRILHAFSLAVESSGSSPPSPVLRLRDGAFNQAVACVRIHARDNLTVKGLTEQTGVSERTLEYAFKEKLGMSPKRFIKAYRLNQVNRELGMRRKGGKTVTEVAQEWGFSHLGQFSRDYKVMFGELPSATRKL